MALGFNSNLFNTNSYTASKSAENAGVIASGAETAGLIASAETAGLIASNSDIDSFQSNNPFAPEVDYSQFAETAGSIADAGCETAGMIAFGDAETAGSIADAGCETAGSVADSGSFGSFDSGFVC